jgi:hypothetical protein
LEVDSVAEIGLFRRGQPVGCTVGILKDQELEQERSEHVMLFLSMDVIPKKLCLSIKK